ncbi:SDR family NAD(P)-dependent oxidoreductase [Cupriavidus basilensis]
MRLADKVALVTGAGSGMGRAMVERFAAEGAAVVIVDRDACAAQATLEEVGGEACGMARALRRCRAAARSRRCMQRSRAALGQARHPRQQCRHRAGAGRRLRALSGACRRARTATGGRRAAHGHART